MPFLDTKGKNIKSITRGGLKFVIHKIKEGPSKDVETLNNFINKAY